MKNILCGTIFIWLVALPAYGQNAHQLPDADSDDAADIAEGGALEDGLVPPKLLNFVAAEYPPDAFEKGIEANVLATIDIDETGKVTSVKVDQPVGNGFDEAATTAMMQFRFAPATQGGQSVACILMYTYRFVITEATTDAQPTDVTEDTADRVLSEVVESAALSGVVMDFDGQSLAAAYVSLKPLSALPADRSREYNVETDEEGRFSFEGIIPGTYTVKVVALGYTQYGTEETLVEGESRDLIYRLDTLEADFEVVVRARKEKPAREVTRQTVTQKEITQIPGTNGDALRAVQNLPGVGLTNFMGGELVIRGSSHADSGYFFNSVGTSLLYHFGGLTSVINSDLLESIDYYPGNYSVKYGRGTGGIIDVNTKTPNTEKFHGYIDVDMFDGGVLLEGPLSENWSLAISGRRSWIDALIQGADLFGDEVQVDRAPRYYDFQVIADYHPRSRDNLKLLLYGTDDRWVMDWDDDPEQDGGLDLHIWTYQAQAQWKHRFSKEWSSELNVGQGHFGIVDNEGEVNLKWGTFPLTIRNEVAFTPNKKLTLRMGTDTVLLWGYLKAHVPGDMYVEGEQYTAAETQWIEMDGNRFYYYPSIYSELELNAIPKTQIVAGLRSDYFSSIDAATIDPRLSTRYQLFKKTTLKGGIGLFHQVPDLQFVDEEYGNPELKPVSAMHYTLGVEQEIFENMKLSAEGFYKDLRHMMTQSDEMVERDGEMVTERYDSDGKGRVYGAEFMLKHNPTERFFGWISYTLMKSQRKDDKGEPWRLFDDDRTHMITAVASLNLGHGFTVGARFRLASGKPEDKIVSAGFDADRNEYYPVYSGNNTLRNPMYHQLDLRIDKKWQWNPLALTVYLDVQNVYNRKNPVAAVHSYDYSKTGYVYDLPIIPSLGIKLEI